MFFQLHHYSLHCCEKGSGVIKHCGEVDCTIMPHWPTVNEVVPFITAQSGTAGCSLVLLSHSARFAAKFTALISRREGEVTCRTP